MASVTGRRIVPAMRWLVFLLGASCWSQEMYLHLETDLARRDYHVTLQDGEAVDDEFSGTFDHTVAVAVAIGGRSDGELYGLTELGCAFVHAGESGDGVDYTRLGGFIALGGGVRPARWLRFETLARLGWGEWSLHAPSEARTSDHGAQLGNELFAGELQVRACVRVAPVECYVAGGAGVTYAWQVFEDGLHQDLLDQGPVAIVGLGWTW